MDNLKELPRMTFADAVKSAFSKLTDFSGRARRSEFWWFMLLFFIIQFAVGLILKSSSMTITSIASVLIYLLALSVTVRRLHDTGRSGWWVLASYAVQIVSTVYTIITLGDLDPVKDTREMMQEVFSPISIVIQVVSFAFTIILLVFCVLDSKPETNQYGQSPKYVDNLQPEL